MPNGVQNTACYRQGWFWILLALILTGGVLRFWALDFGLPNLTRPDENHISTFIVDNILSAFFKGQWNLNPRFFYYPSFYIYLTSICFGLDYLWGHLLGSFENGQAYIELYYNDWSRFHYIQRFISAAFGVASIPAIYLLGLELFKKRGMALLAAGLLSVTYLHVRDSHFGVTDITAVFWVILTLYFTARFVNTNCLKLLVWASIMAGLAAGTKYPDGLVLIAVMAVPVLSGYHSIARQSPEKNFAQRCAVFLSSPRQLLTLLLIPLISLLVFLATTPYLLLDPATATGQILEQSATIQTSYYDYLPPGWWYHISFSLWNGLGGLYTGFALLGVAMQSKWSWQTFQSALMITHRENMHPEEDAAYASNAFSQAIWHSAFLLFIIFFYLANAFTHYVFVRYVLPLVPLFSIYCVIGVRFFVLWTIGKMAGLVSKADHTEPAEAGGRLHAIGSFTQRHRQRIISVASILLTVIVAWYSLQTSVGFDQLLAQQDTRSLARAWLLKKIRPNDGVGIGLVFTHVDLPMQYNRYFLSPESTGYDYENHRPGFRFSPNAVVHTNRHMRREYTISTYSDVETLHRLNIRYIVLGFVSQDLYRLPELEVAAIERQPLLRRVAEFSPRSALHAYQPKTDFDALDGFFVPFHNLSRQVRPGPEIRIYQVLPASGQKK